MRENDAVWPERIQQCRTSGLPDYIWCKENGIAASTFYYHVRKLRENACEVPAPKAAACREKHEVVPIEWGRADASPDEGMPQGRKLPENQTVMKISAGEYSV